MRQTSLLKNTWLNLLGQGVPAIVAFCTLPILMRWIGADRVGVLTTLWVVIGYFGLLDLGLGRAVVHIVAERTAQGRRDEVPNYIWLAVIIIGSLSLVGGLIVAACSSMLVNLVLNVSSQLRVESDQAFFAVALSLPLVTLTSCLRGVIEANQKFVGANVLQAFSSGANAIVPLICAYFSPSLAVLAWGLLVGRGVLLLAHFAVAFVEVPELRNRPHFTKDVFRRLAHFGSWSTISNIVGPVMVYLDRLVVSRRISAAVVPFYAIPHEGVTRLLILPNALTRALFPKMSSLNENARGGLSRRVVAVSTLGLFPMVIAMVYFGTEAMTLWLGADVGVHAAPVLKILAIGYLLNSASYIPFIQLQSLERPDLTARAHLCELPFYIGLLFFLTRLGGEIGAAWAWSFRILVDSVIMFWLASRYAKGTNFWVEISGVLVGALCLLPGIFLHSFAHRALGALVACLVFFTVCWKIWFDEETKLWLLTRLRMRTA